MFLHRVQCWRGNLGTGLVVKENEVVLQVERGEARPDPRNRKIRHESLLLLELLIDRGRVIGKSRFKPCVLPEILVLLRVYALPDLLQAGALLIQLTHLWIEFVDVVPTSPH